MDSLNYNIAKNWLKAFNEHHLENLLLLYYENAEHYSPKLKIKHPETLGMIKGKAALRNWWKDAFEKYPQLEYREVAITENKERVFMEYVRIVTGEENISVAEVLTINENLIVASRVYHG